VCPSLLCLPRSLWSCLWAGERPASGKWTPPRTVDWCGTAVAVTRVCVSAVAVAGPAAAAPVLVLLLLFALVGVGRLLPCPSASVLLIASPPLLLASPPGSLCPASLPLHLSLACPFTFYSSHLPHHPPSHPHMAVLACPTNRLHSPTHPFIPPLASPFTHHPLVAGSCLPRLEPRPLAWCS
jgi:hypothetical protein